jgi:hypothetical protein
MTTRRRARFMQGSLVGVSQDLGKSIHSSLWFRPNALYYSLASFEVLLLDVTGAHRLSLGRGWEDVNVRGPR